jgi:putative tryptophan/tyrosine transport system substrate-binding protein
MAEELVRSAPDMIIIAGDPALIHLHRLTKTIPVVFTQVSDPVDSGFVASLARPGGNVTGFQNFEPEMGDKWLGLLREAMPKLLRVGVLVNSGAAPHAVFLRSINAATPSLGILVNATEVRNAADIEHAIADLVVTPMRDSSYCRIPLQ